MSKLFPPLDERLHAHLLAALGETPLAIRTGLNKALALPRCVVHITVDQPSRLALATGLLERARISASPLQWLGEEDSPMPALLEAANASLGEDAVELILGNTEDEADEEALVVLEHAEAHSARARQLAEEREDALILLVNITGAAAGRLRRSLPKDMETVILDPLGRALDDFKLETVSSKDADSRDQWLLEWLEANQDARAVVFVSTRKQGEALCERLEESGEHAICLHGDMGPAARRRVAGSFQNGDARLLVSTSVGSRMRDLGDARLMLHYDLPADAEDYRHGLGLLPEDDAAVVIMLGDAEQGRAVRLNRTVNGALQLPEVEGEARPRKRKDKPARNRRKKAEGDDANAAKPRRKQARRSGGQGKQSNGHRSGNGNGQGNRRSRGGNRGDQQPTGIIDPMANLAQPEMTIAQIMSGELGGRGSNRAARALMDDPFLAPPADGLPYTDSPGNGNVDGNSIGNEANGNTRRSNGNRSGNGGRRRKRNADGAKSSGNGNGNAKRGRKRNGAGGKGKTGGGKRPWIGPADGVREAKSEKRDSNAAAQRGPARSYHQGDDPVLGHGNMRNKHGRTVEIRQRRSSGIAAPGSVVREAGEAARTGGKLSLRDESK